MNKSHENFGDFYHKLKELPEVVCPIHEEFVFEENNKLKPDENLVDKWASWQDQQMSILFDKGETCVLRERFTHLLNEFFEINFQQISKPGSFFGETMEGFYRSLKPSQFYKMVDLGVEYFHQNQKIDDLMRKGPATKSYHFLLQKKVFPPGTQVTVWGDLHGSAHSLCRGLENYVDSNSWKLKDPNRVLVFLGDYIDRGAYGVETLYVLFHLKVANPEQIFLVRGDHETPIMSMSKDAFLRELKVKFHEEWLFIYETLAKLFNFLPCSFFINISNDDELGNYIQFVHGGLEMVDISTFLLQPHKVEFFVLKSPIEQQDHFFEGETKNQITGFIHKIRKDFSQDLFNGFMWNDFCLDNPNVHYRFGRGFMLNENATRSLLEGYMKGSNKKILTTFRGHQHSGTSNGLLWELISFKGLVPFWKKSHDMKHDNVILQKDGALIYSVLSCPASNLLFSIDCRVEINIESQDIWKLTHIYSKVIASKQANN